ncbi:Heat shock 70 kDa protein 12A [Geodia barretti]|nr:Heat shock 70 kDa protein 12A [Geodia barretti]
MMREAGYKAGLCSRERCPALKEAHTHTPERIEEEKPEKLSLALEPECTAIFCEYKSKMQSSCNSESNESTNENSDNYLVVDIGGGTVDISAHRLVRDPEPHIQVILPPAGNDCGGTQINKEFMRYLEELVDDSGFRRFVLTSDQVVNSKHRFILSAIMNQKFEDIKKLFGKRVKFMGSVHLFPEFVETYENNIKRGLEKSDSIIQLVGLNLRVSRELMTSLFEKTANGIIACIDEVIEKVGSIRLIYLAGGFGGSHYIKKLVTERLKEKDIKCIVPVDHPYAVARGAALFKMNPSVIECRKVDATYGIQANTRFQHGLHDPKYMWTDDDNKLQCKNIFCTVVEKGDIVGKGEVFSMTFNPASHNQKNVLIEFYSSQDTDVFYVTGEWGIGKCEPRHTVTKIGQITVDMPVPDGDKKRGVDVIFSFSHTEIKVRALDQTSNTEVKTVLDFLNTQTV